MSEPGRPGKVLPGPCGQCRRPKAVFEWDTHGVCLKCLGPDHEIKGCEHCECFRAQPLKRRAKRVALWRTQLQTNPDAPCPSQAAALAWFDEDPDLRGDFVADVLGVKRPGKSPRNRLDRLAPDKSAPVEEEDDEQEWVANSAGAHVYQEGVEDDYREPDQSLETENLSAPDGQVGSDLGRQADSQSTSVGTGDVRSPSRGDDAASGVDKRPRKSPSGTGGQTPQSRKRVAKKRHLDETSYPSWGMSLKDEIVDMMAHMLGSNNARVEALEKRVLIRESQQRSRFGRGMAPATQSQPDQPELEIPAQQRGGGQGPYCPIAAA